jgi:tRNA modification GTPase
MERASSNGWSSVLAGGADTIVARATPAGPGALAVVRVSGIRARDVAAHVAPKTDNLVAWRGHLVDLVDERGEPLDRAVAVWYEGPRSYTGEDMLELILHGSPKVVEEAIACCVAGGARFAEPGEFTRRAVANGKMDLIEAEAIRDLIAAETACQVRNARRQMRGELSCALSTLRARVVGLLARLEASLDFVEDGALIAGEDLAGEKRECEEAIRQLLETARRGERIRNGVRVAIVGRPNAGKSTLFNAMLRRNRAMVSPHPGTTRDVLEAEVELGGLRMVLVDTAGIRRVEDELEQEGVRRAQAAGADADVCIVLWAADAPSEWGPPSLETDGEVLRVWTKTDIAGGRRTPDGWMGVSAESGDGLEALRTRLCGLIAGGSGGADDRVAIGERHRAGLERALEELGGCDLGQPELAAESVRWSVRALDAVMGTVDAEEVLDAVFSTFCIGK